MKNLSFYMLLLITAFFFSCEKPNPNLDKSGEDTLKSLEIGRKIDRTKMAFQDTLYVPIYSDIYVDQRNQNTLLAATLSIRNTSYVDSLIISKIEYFNTTGDLVRSYVENSISIPPMATINYVVEKDDDTGGPGANFIVVINSRNREVNPLIQAVMIGESGNKGFAFTTNGHSIKKK